MSTALDWQSDAMAAYVHIPFCVRKCLYCDFISYPGLTADVQQAYCAALLREIGQAADWAGRQGKPGLSGPLRSVFVGGGTPTVLAPDLLTGILSALQACFGLDPAGEFTLEANPGTVTAASLAVIRQGGFNRISFGLQAAQPALLGRLGRIHGPGDFAASVKMAADAGFTAINADIMIGLPEQTLADVVETLQLVLSLPVDHVSFYSLILEDGTPLKTWCEAHPDSLPDEQLEREQYHLLRQLLKKEGFEHYEISNAARPGCRCRHNLVYWQGKAYYGFGVAAHSYLSGIRRSNTTDLNTYLGQFGPASGEGAFPAGQVEEVIDQREAEKEMLLLGLRLLEGVRYADFSQRFGADLRDRFGRQISQLTKRGLLESDPDGIRLSAAGLDLANQVFCEFV